MANVFFPLIKLIFHYLFFFLNVIFEVLELGNKR